MAKRIEVRPGVFYHSGRISRSLELAFYAGDQPTVIMRAARPAELPPAAEPKPDPKLAAKKREIEEGWADG